MKLRPLTNGLPSIVPARGGELLSPSLPNSVSQRKKPASLAGFLFLGLDLTPLIALFLLCRRASLHLSLPQVEYSNSK